MSQESAVNEGLLRGLFNRVLQQFARVVPGATSLRVSLHRARGVQIGRGVWIGYDVILETSRPSLIVLEDDCTLSVRVMIVAHFRESKGVKIEKGVFVGPGAIILPGVVVGRGSVVTAGSVVTRSVPPMTVVQGNPAIPVARCEVSLMSGVGLEEFPRHLRPLSFRGKPAESASDSQTQSSNR